MNRPPLNNDQDAAVKAVSAFIISDEKEFFLTGGPGVGKTFTTRNLADHLPQILLNYEKAMNSGGSPKQVVLTSTTNKAAAVLSEQTGHEAQTIHSFLGVIPKYDMKTGKTSLKTTGAWRVHSNKIIFVDEASMIDRRLYELIQEGTDETCKIIYIGDKNQLAPVMEKLSPAVALAADKDLHYEITQPVRNANSPALLALCNRLRDDILLERPKDQLTNWPSVPGEIEYLDGPQFEQLVRSTFGPGGSVKETDKELSSRILCYTNKTVIAYNHYIRKLRGLPEHPIPGEVLVCNSHFKISSDKAFNVEEMIDIHEVGDVESVPVCQYNSLNARKIVVSTPWAGKREVWCPELQTEYRSLRAHYKKHKAWRDFFKMEELFIDLRNREAATVYKAQGSTHDSVILVMNDIFSSRDVNQLRRMLYVGASRARNKVYLYDKGIYENARGIYQ